MAVDHNKNNLNFLLGEIFATHSSQIRRSFHSVENPP